MEAVNHPPAAWGYLSVTGPLVPAGCNGGRPLWSEGEVKVWWMSWWSPCSSGAQVPTHLQVTLTWAQIYNWCVHTKHIRTPFLTLEWERLPNRCWEDVWKNTWFVLLWSVPASSSVWTLPALRSDWASAARRRGDVSMAFCWFLLFIQSDGVETWRASAETSSCNSCRIN